MIELDHIELTTEPRPLTGENNLTYVRYWQAQVPGTELFAVTEEGFTVKNPETREYVHITQFFICRKGASADGPAGDYVSRTDTYIYGYGSVLEACQQLGGPAPWTDAPRQAMLVEAIESVTQDA